MTRAQYKAERAARFSDTEISVRQYNLVIGFVVLSGLLLNIVMAATLMEPILSLPMVAIDIIYAVGTIGLYVVIRLSPNPFVSYVAFLGLACAMGVFVTWYVAHYNLGTVTAAFIITGIVTLILILISAAFPGFFLSIGRALFISLITSIVAGFVLSFVFGLGTTIIDLAVAVIFCGYIGYDWAKAQQCPKTYDNAVDSAADLYTDIVFLFLELLSLLGDSDD